MHKRMDRGGTFPTQPEGSPVTEPLLPQLAALTGILPILRELARGTTLTDTAERLGMSQPALSRAMARYQQELSVRLIERDGRRIRLSAEGEMLADAAVKALGAFEPVLHDILDTSHTRPLRLGALRSMSGELAPMLAESSPEMRAHIIEGSSPELLSALRSSHIDAAVLGPRPDSTEFTWSPLRHQPFVLVVPSTHPLADRGVIELQEFSGDKFVAMAPGYTARSLADELCAEAGIKPVITIESDSSYTLRSYVAAGLGVCILPETMVAPDPGLVCLEIRRVDGTLAYREMGLVRLRGAPQPARLQGALRRLVKRIRT